MDIQDIDSRMELVKASGMCLNVHERLQLEIGLTELCNESDCDELLFWGKIFGDKSDYFIAECLHFQGKYEFPDKHFYWATSKDYKFYPLPDPLEQHNQFADMTDAFSGDPIKIIKNLEAPEGEGEENAAAKEGEGEGEDDLADSTSEDDAVKVPPKNFTELDRLAFVVRAIENDCQIVPLGSVKLTPKHEVRRNEAFRGLCKEKSQCLNSYVHFRSVQDGDKKNKNEMDDAIFQPDFLEAISADPIKGSWSVQADTTGAISIVRSLLWHGYVAFHKLGTQTYGGVYIGNGVKNADLPFML